MPGHRLPEPLLDAMPVSVLGIERRLRQLMKELIDPPDQRSPTVASRGEGRASNCGLNLQNAPHIRQPLAAKLL